MKTRKVIAGLVAGLLAGVIFSLLVNSPFPLGLDLVISAGLGLIFALVSGPKIQTTGAGLVWGEAYAILWWLLGTLTLVPLLSGSGPSWNVTALQQAFPFLLGQIVSYGLVLGAGYHWLVSGIDRFISKDVDASSSQAGHRIPTGQSIVPASIQLVIVGGLGGLLGSWVFAWGIETADFYPLVAGLVRSNSMMVGQALHYTIGTVIGVSFGLLFCRDVRGAGSGLVWGMNYGLFWWIIGPMTLMPWLLGVHTGRPDWSIGAAQSAFPSTVAHVLYGALVGLFFALVNKLWELLFVESDPLNRSVEGIGARGLRGILMGQAGGLIGGLLFTAVMVDMGALPQVAKLVLAESPITGLIVHLIISLIIGSSFGLLFHREAYSHGSGLAWGVVYGLLWWFLGGLTLFPILLRQPVDWSPEAAVTLYPSLVGHLLYGAGLGLLFQFLARRYEVVLADRRPKGLREARLRYQTNRPPKRRTAGTPASALWVVTLTLGIVLPLLFSTGG